MKPKYMRENVNKNRLSPVQKKKSVAFAGSPKKSNKQVVSSPSSCITNYFKPQTVLPLSKKNSAKRTFVLNKECVFKDVKSEKNEDNLLEGSSEIITSKTLNPTESDDKNSHKSWKAQSALTSSQGRNAKRKLLLDAEVENICHGENAAPQKKVIRDNSTRSPVNRSDSKIGAINADVIKQIVTLISNNLRTLCIIFEKSKTILDDKQREEFVMLNINRVVTGTHDSVTSMSPKHAREENGEVSNQEQNVNKFKKICPQISFKLKKRPNFNTSIETNSETFEVVGISNVPTLNSQHLDINTFHPNKSSTLQINGIRSMNVNTITEIPNIDDNKSVTMKTTPVKGQMKSYDMLEKHYLSSPTGENDTREEESSEEEENNFTDKDDKLIAISLDENILNSEQTSSSAVMSNAINYSIDRAKIYAPCIFSNDANQICRAFKNLKYEEQTLYENLLARKWTWIRKESIKYFNIECINSSLESLYNVGFIQTMNRDCKIQEILHVLNVQELTILCNYFNIEKKGKKQVIIKKLLSTANSKGLPFCQTRLKDKLIDKALEILEGELIKLAEHPRYLFLQLLVASTCPYYYSDEVNRLADLRIKLLNTYKGYISLLPLHAAPQELFKTPTQFEQYFRSVQLKGDLQEAKKIKDWPKAADICETIKDELKLFFDVKYNKNILLDNIPYCKLQFTAGANLVYCLSCSINVLKTVNRYDLCIECLNLLLNQHHYSISHKAKWYEQKALILEKYKKEDADSIYQVLKAGLSDSSLTLLGHRILSKRAECYIKSKKFPQEKKEELRNIISMPVAIQTVEIYAKSMPTVTKSKRQVFETKNDDGQKYFGSVEETVCNFYHQSYAKSFHDEGELLRKITLALFFPIIYDTQHCPGMFVSEFQNHPLDWGTQDFFNKRKELFHAHRYRIMEKGLDGARKDFETVCSIIDNKPNVLFKISKTDIPDMMQLLTCMTLEKFMSFAFYLLEYYKERKSGLPDLTMFNNDMCVFVEVKGPNDTASINQLLWMEKLQEFGLHVWICKVSTKVACKITSC